MGVNMVTRISITTQVTLDVSENRVLGEYLNLTGRKLQETRGSSK
jgi:hypothetical protein